MSTNGAPSNEPIEMGNIVTYSLPDECAASKWNQRKTKSSGSIPFLSFLATVTFWMRVEYAVRVAFVGVLPTAIIAYHPDTTKEWIVPGAMLTYCIVVSQNSVARALEEFIGVVRSLVLVIVIVEISYAIDSARNWIGWGALFCGTIVLVAVFTQGIVTKLGLFGWSIFMVLQYQTTQLTPNKYSGPPEFMKQGVVAAGFGLLTAFFPYPYFETWNAEKIEKRILRMQAQMFHGLTESVYTNNLVRSANLVTIRQLYHNVERDFVNLRATLDLAHVEVWFRNRVHAMSERLEVIMRVHRDMTAAIEVLEHVNRNAHVWDENQNHQRFGALLLPSMRAAAVQFEFFMTKFASNFDADVRAQVVSVHQMIDTHFQDARKEVIFTLLDTVTDNRPFDHFPFLSSNSFLFPWKDCLLALQEYEVSAEPAPFAWLWHVVTFPIRDLRDFWQTLVGIATFDAHTMIRIREACKLAFAMTTAVALLMGRQGANPAGGAAVIGFLMDADPSNNVLTGVRFMLGCIFGSVFGLLCISVAESLTQTIIWITVITLVTGFGKTGPKWGQTYFFVMFFGLASMEPGVTANAIIKTIQQDVTSIVWLVFVSNFFWPLYPSTSLNVSVEDSIVLARKFLLTFFSEFAQIRGSNRFDKNLLQRMMHEVRSMAIRQGPLIEGAMEEPAISTEPFPAHVYRHYNRTLRRVIADFAPLIVAGNFVANQESRMHLLTAVEPHISKLCDALNILLRTLEETIHVKPYRAWGGGTMVSATPKPIDDLLRDVTSVRLICEATIATAQRAFMEQWNMIKEGTHRVPNPYEVPASHLILGTVDRLPLDMYELVLAVIAIRDAQA